MKEIYFGDFRLFVVGYVKVLEQQEIESYSTEWFLLKYLRRVVKAAEIPTTPGKVEGSIRSLVRFYIDNIDEKSELGDQCIKIYDEYRKTLRMAQEK